MKWPCPFPHRWGFFFCHAPSQARTAIAYAFNREFSPVLQRQMAYFSKSAGGDALSAVRGEVAQVKDIMVQNIEKVLERSEHINILVDKTENLEQEVGGWFLASGIPRMGLVVANVSFSAGDALQEDERQAQEPDVVAEPKDDDHPDWWVG